MSQIGKWKRQTEEDPLTPGVPLITPWPVKQPGEQPAEQPAEQPELVPVRRTGDSGKAA